MKIALIQPEYQYHRKNRKITALTLPMSLLSLHEDSEIFDLNICEEPDFGKFDIVGVTAMTINYKRALKIISNAKRKRCITVLGGIHATSLPENVLEECPDLDIVVRGEGESTFRELVDLYSRDRTPGMEDLQGIEGISFRADGRVLHTPDRALIKNLDEIETNYDKINLANYRVAPHHSFGAKYTEPFVSYMTSRGCPYNCTFCASKLMWGRRVRFKSSSKIADEIDNLIVNRGVRNIDFYDDTFTLHPEFNKLMTILKPYGISFSCLSRVDVIDEEMIIRLKEAGCYAIRFGIESGNTGILKSIRKGFKKEQAIKAMRLCAKYGLWSNCCFIFGFPEETRKTAQETIHFARQLSPDLAFFYILMPLPGTEIEAEMKKGGLITEEGYFEFLDKGTNVRSRHLSSADLIRIRKKAYYSFYLRPTYVLSALSKIRTKGDVINYFSGFMSTIFS